MYEYESKIRRVRRFGVLAGQSLIIKSSYDAASVVRPFITGESLEHFLVLCLSSRGELLGVDVVAVGGLDWVQVECRNIFLAAILCSAKMIVIAHNHPSGNLWPSANDELLTARTMELGDLIGIPVVDHVIVTEGGHYSFYSGGAFSRESEPERMTAP